jgi:hypothetical protein
VRPLLKKVPALGGAPLLIAEAPGMYGASWAETGEIVVSTGDRLAAIAANGGTFRTLSRPDTAAKELKQLWPVRARGWEYNPLHGSTTLRRRVTHRRCATARWECANSGFAGDWGTRRD